MITIESILLAIKSLFKNPAENLIIIALFVIVYFSMSKFWPDQIGLNLGIALLFAASPKILYKFFQKQRKKITPRKVKRLIPKLSSWENTVLLEIANRGDSTCDFQHIPHISASIINLGRLGLLTWSVNPHIGGVSNRGKRTKVSDEVLGILRENIPLLTEFSKNKSRTN